MSSTVLKDGGEAKKVHNNIGYQYGNDKRDFNVNKRLVEIHAMKRL